MTKKLALLLVALTGCLHSEERSYVFKVTIKNDYVAHSVRQFIKDNAIDSKNSIVKIVFFETISHQYTYISSSSNKLDYRLFQPEGWLILDETFVLVCQSGNFYNRNNTIINEINDKIKSLGINLNESNNFISEPSGIRLVYCTRTKVLKKDDYFFKLKDEECE